MSCVVVPESLTGRWKLVSEKYLTHTQNSHADFGSCHNALALFTWIMTAGAALDYFILLLLYHFCSVFADFLRDIL